MKFDLRPEALKEKKGVVIGPMVCLLFIEIHVTQILKMDVSKSNESLRGLKPTR